MSYLVDELGFGFYDEINVLFLQGNMTSVELKAITRTSNPECNTLTIASYLLPSDLTVSSLGASSRLSPITYVF